MKSRSAPGAFRRRSGLWNVSFGKARTILYGGGGSGEPGNRDVVKGTRFEMPNGRSSASDRATKEKNRRQQREQRPTCFIFFRLKMVAKLISTDFRSSRLVSQSLAETYGSNIAISRCFLRFHVFVEIIQLAV